MIQASQRQECQLGTTKVTNNCDKLVDETVLLKYQIGMSKCLKVSVLRGSNDIQILYFNNPLKIL